MGFLRRHPRSVRPCSWRARRAVGAPRSVNSNTANAILRRTRLSRLFATGGRPPRPSLRPDPIVASGPHTGAARPPQRVARGRHPPPRCGCGWHRPSSPYRRDHTTPTPPGLRPPPTRSPPAVAQAHRPRARTRGAALFRSRQLLGGPMAAAAAAPPPPPPSKPPAANAPPRKGRRRQATAVPPHHPRVPHIHRTRPLAPKTEKRGDHPAGRVAIVCA